MTTPSSRRLLADAPTRHFLVGVSVSVGVGVGLALTLAACGSGGTTSTSGTSSAKASISATPSPKASPSATRPAGPSYTVGQTVTGQRFAAALLDAMNAAGTATIRTTTPEGTVDCTVDISKSGGIIVRNPVDGVTELRLIRDDAYVLDQPGSEKPWYTMNFIESPTGEVPSEALASVLNRSSTWAAGDCYWRERLAAINPSGSATVTGDNGDSWTLTAPTDPESQAGKSSASDTPYVDGTWVVGKDGLPNSYASSDGTRSVAWSAWGVDHVTPPPADQIRHGG